MSLIDEFRFYCEDPSPVGALLFTGDWGSGKTYFIEHELISKLADKYVFIRVSLFGLNSLTDLRKIVSRKYVEYISGISDNAAKAFRNTKKVLSELPVPGFVKNILSIDFLDFVIIGPSIGDKQLVLIFDDLERTAISFVDVLGCINDYCENNSIHIIIVANEQVIYERSNASNEIDSLHYHEIKEKVVQRTLKYSPDYTVIVSDIIRGYKTENIKYKTFLKNVIKQLVDFFFYKHSEYQNDVSVQSKMPVNLRILKSSLYDFERIFPLLSFATSIEELFKWLSTFLCFALTWKTGKITKAQALSSENRDNILTNTFAAWYDKSYSIWSVQRWMIEGEWDEKEVADEIKLLNERNNNQLPDAIVNIKDLCSIDDSIMEKGFPIVLEKAYEGKLSLNDYVSLIEKSIIAREIQYTFSIPIDWNRVYNGIKLCIHRMIINNEPDSSNKIFLSNQRAKLLNNDECKAYDIIKHCRTDEQLQYETKKSSFLKQMELDPINTLRSANKYRFLAFHKDVMDNIISTYLNLNNNDKCFFEIEFNTWWGDCYLWNNFNIDESIINFQIMSSSLKRKADESLINGKQLESINIKRFSELIDKIILNLSNSLREVPVVT